MDETSEVVARIRRWTDAGGTWQFISRSADGITVGLYRCDAGEEMDRLSSADPSLAAFVDAELTGETWPSDPRGFHPG